MCVLCGGGAVGCKNTLTLTATVNTSSAVTALFSSLTIFIDGRVGAEAEVGPWGAGGV